ncbi:hypothetical protein D3C71_1647930 [compost metagenome]
MDANEETTSTGSRIRSSMATFSSVMRLTKLELAPFSSRRRTRYGSRSSCEPTGAYTRHGTFRRSAGTTSAYRSSPMPCSFWCSYWPPLAIACTAAMVCALCVANIG